MAQIAAVVIDHYGVAYPELVQHRQTILDSLTREEKRFQRTVESGLGHLNDLLDEMKKSGEKFWMVAKPSICTRRMVYLWN